MSGSMSGMWKRVMVEPLRHRQTKEAATDMFDLQPPRHISTLRARHRGSDERRSANIVRAAMQKATFCDRHHILRDGRTLGCVAPINADR
jgi:hypothetical protein